MKHEYELYKIKTVPWVILCFFFLSCEPAIDPIRKFTIRKGEHYAWPKVTETLQSNRLVSEVKFNNSAIYDFNDLAIQSNKNKLIGFCDCNSSVHENSARFAWQWFNDQLEIFAYCYADGERQEKFVGVVDIGTFNRYEIEIKEDHYVFRLNDEQAVTMERAKKCSTGAYYKLWPYFGGQVPAPHEVTIEVKAVY